MIKSDISNVINKQKHIVSLECDFKVSKNCKKKWKTSFRTVMKTRSNNNGKDCCNICASKIKNSGDKNPAFKHPKNEKYFEKINSEIKAYLLGWIASDGCIGKKAFFVEIHKKDIKILKLFKVEICPTSKITYRKDRNTCWIAISSKNIIKDLCNVLNVKPKSKQNKLRLPKLQSRLMKHFLRGFLEGDGHIHNKRTVCSIASIDPKLRKDIIKYSKTLKIKSSNNAKTVEWNGSNAIAFLNHLYKNAKYVLDRKYKLYIKKLK